MSLLMMVNARLKAAVGIEPMNTPRRKHGFSLVRTNDMDSLRVWIIAIVTASLLVAAAFVLLSGNAKLGLFVPLPIIGLVVGGLIMPLTETAGGMLRAWALLAGVVGSVAAGMLAARMGLTLFGAGSQLL